MNSIVICQTRLPIILQYCHLLQNTLSVLCQIIKSGLFNGTKRHIRGGAPDFQHTQRKVLYKV